MKAIWNNQVIAESNDTIIVENNHYFPKDSVKTEYLKPCATQSTCPWKGLASYYTLSVDELENNGAAWFYPSQKMPPGTSKIMLPFGKALK